MGTATALALSKVVPLDRFEYVRTTVPEACVPCGVRFTATPTLRSTFLGQQFSKDTDQMSRGRQMVYHLDIREMGILPVQSPVGMQLSKAAGYAQGFRFRESMTD